MKYAYREHEGYPGLDPNCLAEELIKIREKHGVLTPTATVNAAKSPKSVLHPYFEWDDTVAAEEFRNHQARRMIRSVYVVIEEKPDWEIPANINIRGNGERGYYPAADVMGSPGMREEALQRVRDSLLRLRRLYSHMEQFAAVWKAIDKTERKAVGGRG